MRLRKFFSCCIALLLCLAISAPAFSAPLTKVRTAWMDEFEAFPIWYAKEKGWDKEAGLDLEILYFTSGMAILNALPSGEWQYAAIGAVPLEELFMMTFNHILLTLVERRRRLHPATVEVWTHYVARSRDAKAEKGTA